MAEQVKMSFELNEEMLGIIAREYDYSKVVDKFSAAIKGKKTNDVDGVARDVFGTYGAEWIKRCMQLGEEYSDRTYEILREADDLTGGDLRFPLIPQRILEIAYLAILDLELLPVVENNKYRLIYRIENCKVFKDITEKCGKDIASTLP
jgi:hypothetical protein